MLGDSVTQCYSRVDEYYLVNTVYQSMLKKNDRVTRFDSNRGWRKVLVAVVPASIFGNRYRREGIE